MGASSHPRHHLNVTYYTLSSPPLQQFYRPIIHQQAYPHTQYLHQHTIPHEAHIHYPQQYLDLQHHTNHAYAHLNQYQQSSD